MVTVVMTGEYIVHLFIYSFSHLRRHSRYCSVHSCHFNWKLSYFIAYNRKKGLKENEELGQPKEDNYFLLP